MRSPQPPTPTSNTSTARDRPRAMTKTRRLGQWQESPSRFVYREDDGPRSLMRVTPIADGADITDGGGVHLCGLIAEEQTQVRRVGDQNDGKHCMADASR